MRVAKVYVFLRARSEKLDQMEVLPLVTAPPGLLLDPRFITRQRFFAARLREFFSGEGGREASLVLGLAKGIEVVSKKEERDSQVQYGVNAHGPYKLITFKKLPLRRMPPPVLTRISLEELCFYEADTKDAYFAVFRLMNRVVTETLGEK